MAIKIQKEQKLSDDKKSSKIPWIVLAVVLAVLTILVVIFWGKLGARPGESRENFQAVFLTNGQVYFGKLAEETDRYIILTKIYYLQVTPTLQTKTGTDIDTTASLPPPQPGSGMVSDNSQELSLVKLGNELHGPMDEMRINRQQVLFVEDLKDDSRVVQAIREFERNK